MENFCRGWIAMRIQNSVRIAASAMVKASAHDSPTAKASHEYRIVKLRANDTKQ